jgi:hypothetical protein
MEKYFQVPLISQPEDNGKRTIAALACIYSRLPTLALPARDSLLFPTSPWPSGKPNFFWRLTLTTTSYILNVDINTDGFTHFFFATYVNYNFLHPQRGY